MSKLCEKEEKSFSFKVFQGLNRALVVSDLKTKKNNVDSLCNLFLRSICRKGMKILSKRSKVSDLRNANQPFRRIKVRGVKFLPSKKRISSDLTIRTLKQLTVSRRTVRFVLQYNATPCLSVGRTTGSRAERGLYRKHADLSY